MEITEAEREDVYKFMRSIAQYAKTYSCQGLTFSAFSIDQKCSLLQIRGILTSINDWLEKSSAFKKYKIEHLAWGKIKPMSENIFAELGLCVTFDRGDGSEPVVIDRGRGFRHLVIGEEKVGPNIKVLFEIMDRNLQSPIEVEVDYSMNI